MTASSTVWYREAGLGTHLPRVGRRHIPGWWEVPYTQGGRRLYTQHDSLLFSQRMEASLRLISPFSPKGWRPLCAHSSLFTLGIPTMGYTYHTLGIPTMGTPTTPWVYPT